MKNFLGSLAVYVFSAVVLINFFGPVLIGVFSLFAAAYFFYGPEPSRIAGLIFALISLACYHGVVYWGWVS